MTRTVASYFSKKGFASSPFLKACWTPSTSRKKDTIKLCLSLSYSLLMTSSPLPSLRFPDADCLALASLGSECERLQKTQMKFALAPGTIKWPPKEIFKQVADEARPFDEHHSLWCVKGLKVRPLPLRAENGKGHVWWAEEEELTGIMFL